MSKLNRISKVAESLADYAQIVARTVYLQLKNNGGDGTKMRHAKEILKMDLLALVDEYVQNQSTVHEYHEKEVKDQLKKNQIENEKLASSIFNKKIKELFGKFENYIDAQFEKSIEKRVLEIERKILRSFDRKLEDFKDFMAKELEHKVTNFRNLVTGESTCSKK